MLNGTRVLVINAVGWLCCFYITSPAFSVRYCDSCTSSEVCVALTGDYFPTCRDAADPEDPTGCAGLCAVDTQVCHRLDRDAFRYVRIAQYSPYASFI